jgi:hypothetical protein
VHVASFRAGFPLELHPFNCGAPNVRMNRHEYCELMYIYSGCGEFQIQDREFEVRSGDLVVGPSLHHRVYLPAGARMNIAVLFFQPELLNDPSTAESATYLIRFFQQFSDIHVLSLPRAFFGASNRSPREQDVRWRAFALGGDNGF